MVSSEKRVIGCLVIQNTITAYPAIVGSEGTDQVSKEAVQAIAEGQNGNEATEQVRPGRSDPQECGNHSKIDESAAADSPSLADQHVKHENSLEGKASSLKSCNADTRCKPLAALMAPKPRLKPALQHGKKKQRSDEALLGVDTARAELAMAGVKGIWVSLTARRGGVASQLLDSARYAIALCTKCSPVL